MGQPRQDAVGTSSADSVDVEDFLEIVLADDELLAAEFDAIIEEAWSGRRSAPDPFARRQVQRCPAPATAQGHAATPSPAPPRPPGPRVRSPPCH